MLNAWSRIYYGFEVTESNQYLSFNEGGPELIASVRPGKYSLTQGLDALATAMSDVGSQVYSASVDRETRRVTISATGAFSLLITTGSTFASSIFPMLGFAGADVGPGMTFTGAGALGTSYHPQFKFQDWVSPDHFKRSVDSTVKKTAGGQVEVVTFGRERLIQLNIRYATDRPMDGRVIRNNPAGVQALVDLMDWLVMKAPVEIIPNEASPATFYTAIIEKTPDSPTGVDYKLRELYEKQLPEFFETGILQFVVVE